MKIPKLEVGKQLVVYCDLLEEISVTTVLEKLDGNQYLISFENDKGVSQPYAAEKFIGACCDFHLGEL